MTRINSISTRLYGNISFNSSSTLKKRYDGSIHRTQTEEGSKHKKGGGYGNGYMFADISFHAICPSIYDVQKVKPAPMPKDVEELYSTAKKFTSYIRERLYGDKKALSNNDITLDFDSLGDIVQIYDNHKNTVCSPKNTYVKPEYYDTLKDLADGNFYAGIVLNDGSIAQIETLRLKNGRPESASFYEISKGHLYKVRYKNGLPLRFEASSKINNNERRVEILNYKNGKPVNYIRFEHLVTDTNSKSIRWIKFYDLIDGKWIATPQDNSQKTASKKDAV